MKTLLKNLIPYALLPLVSDLYRELFLRGSTGNAFLDLKLIENISPNQSHGYYVELGANNGIRQSNTYKLQKAFGWSGLLIEPSPAEYIQCVHNRSFPPFPNFSCSACVPFDFRDKFVSMEYSGLMTAAHDLDIRPELVSQHVSTGSQFLSTPNIHHQFGAVARTLNSILDQFDVPHNFDLLSLDVEGNELSVLKGLDFQTYRPKWILVEIHQHSDVIHFLQSRNYEIKAILSEHKNYRDVLFSPVKTC